MKKVGIYGGSFNPIANHHIQIAQKALDYVDEVWLLPCYKSMSSKKLESGHHRLAMCRLAIGHLNNIKVCDFEIRNKFTGNPAIVIRQLMHDFPTYQFYFVIGTDNACNIHNWINGHEAIELLPYIVFPRKDYFVDQYTWFKKSPHIYISNFELQSGSSTQFREEYRRNGHSKLVNSNVIAYIQQNSLYQTSNL